MAFHGHFTFDEVFDDPVGALRWAEAAWTEVNFVEGIQDNYNLYNCRDKYFESRQEENHPRAVFPLAKLLVDKLSGNVTSPYLGGDAFIGVAADATLFPELGIDQQEVERAAMAAGYLISQHMRDWADITTALPLWAMNASLGGASMLTATWRTESRMMPVGGEVVTKGRTITLPGGKTKVVQIPEVKEQVVRECIDLEAKAPGTWGIDPEARNMQDLVWGYYDDFVPPSTILEFVKSKYFNLVTMTEAKQFMGGYGNRYMEEQVLKFKHLFESSQHDIYFGQASSGSLQDRVCLRTFYTKEVRIYSCNGMLLRIEPSPYALLSDGFPFEILTANGTGNLLGTSDLYYLKPYFFEYNRLRNSELYNAELASDQAWITQERNVKTIEDFKYRQAGSIIFSNLGPDAFTPIPFNPISPEVKGTRMGILEDLYLIAGLNEASLGATPAASVRSQKQLSSLLQTQSGRMDSANQKTAAAMRSVARKALCQYRNFMTEDSVVKLGADQNGALTPFSPYHFGAVHDIELRNSFEEQAKQEHNKGDLMQIFPVLAQVPGFDASKLAADILRNMGFNPEKYLTPGTGPTIPQAGGQGAGLGPEQPGSPGDTPQLTAPQQNVEAQALGLPN